MVGKVGVGGWDRRVGIRGVGEVGVGKKLGSRKWGIFAFNDEKDSN